MIVLGQSLKLSVPWRSIPVDQATNCRIKIIYFVLNLLFMLQIGILTSSYERWKYYFGEFTIANALFFFCSTKQKSSIQNVRLMSKPERMSNMANSTLFHDSCGHFWPNCGHMATLLKLNLRLSSTPMTAAAAATAAAIKILGYIALIGYIWGY